jgi:hypothetical protein
MEDPRFRAEQLGDLYAPHVKAVNKLVDELRVDADRWMPHLAPMHAGVLARLLVIGPDPGPNLDRGRAYEALLSVEDDNAAAARIGALLKRARIDPAEVTLWNAYPWYTAGDLAAGDVRAGLEPLRRLVELLPELEVVVLLGTAAERLWRTFTSTLPDEVPYATVLTTREVADAAFEGTNAQRHQWREEQAETFLEAGRLLRER